jgi:hypothetical protein
MFVTASIQNFRKIFSDVAALAEEYWNNLNRFKSISH